MHNWTKRFVAVILSFFILFGLSFFLSPAVALTKKASRKVKAKKVLRKKRSKKVRSSRHKLPAPVGFITQTYILEEGIDEMEAEELASTLKSAGVNEARVNVNENSVQVKFSPEKLSAIKIINKFKTLGYTIRRIN